MLKRHSTVAGAHVNFEFYTVAPVQFFKEKELFSGSKFCLVYNTAQNSNPTTTQKNYYVLLLRLVKMI